MKSLNIAAIVFDLDGTLVDLGAHVKWDIAQNELVKLYNSYDLNIEKVNDEGLIHMLEKVRETLLEGESEEKVLQIQSEAYGLLCDHETNACYKCSLMDGFLEALEWLKKREVKIGLCTSNSQRSAETVLKHHNIEHYFDAIVGRTVKFKIKPDPEQLRECLRLLKANPSRSVMVGDSHKDVISGKALGTFTIAVPTYFSNIDKIREAGVDKIINNLYELPSTLLSI